MVSSSLEFGQLKLHLIMENTCLGPQGPTFRPVFIPSHIIQYLPGLSSELCKGKYSLSLFFLCPTFKDQAIKPVFNKQARRVNRKEIN